MKIKKKFRCEKRQYYHKISNLFTRRANWRHLSISSRVDFISREIARSLIGSDSTYSTLLIKSAKIAPARSRRLAASVHRSIYPSTHPSTLPIQAKCQRRCVVIGGPAVSRGLSFATHAVPRSFVHRRHGRR